MNRETRPTDGVRDDRHGWPFTLGKCAFVTSGSTAVMAVTFWWILRHLDRPWFIPVPVYQWLIETVLPYALWVGGALGLFFGVISSIGIVVLDARRGRLTRLP